MYYLIHYRRWLIIIVMARDGLQESYYSTDQLHYSYYMKEGVKDEKNGDMKREIIYKDGLEISIKIY